MEKKYVLTVEYGTGKIAMLTSTNDIGEALKEFLADKIWEYLNEPFGSAYYVSREMLGVYL